MKLNPDSLKNHHRIIPVTCLLAAFALTLSFFTSTASANSCQSMEVKILHYYGCQREDPDGHKLYGVKVRHGGKYYYAELRSAVPCLWIKTNQYVNITMCKHSCKWDKVTYRHHTASIYRIKEVDGPFWQPPTWGLFNLW